MSPLEMVKALRALEYPVVVDYGVNRRGKVWTPVLVLNSYACPKKDADTGDYGPDDRKNGTVTFCFGPTQETAEAAMAIGASLLGVPVNELSDDWRQ